MVDNKTQKDCIFCKIALKQIPSNTVYEDKMFMAFLDIGPVNYGHTLVIPKKHFETFLDIHGKELDLFMGICQRVARAQMKALSAVGFNLMLNNARAAGQVVDHVHFHIVPRFLGDGLKLWPQKRYNSQDEANQIVAKIKRFL